jgi:hypothetical protein
MVVGVSIVEILLPVIALGMREKKRVKAKEVKEGGNLITNMTKMR